MTIQSIATAALRSAEERVEKAADGVRRALEAAPSLHEWAAQESGATPFQGRATAWGVRLPGSGLDVVVRHARRGGVLAHKLYAAPNAFL